LLGLWSSRVSWAGMLQTPSLDLSDLPLFNFAFLWWCWCLILEASYAVLTVSIAPFIALKPIDREITHLICVPNFILFLMNTRESESNQNSWIGLMNINLRANISKSFFLDGIFAMHSGFRPFDWRLIIEIGIYLPSFRYDNDYL
jgi:hypothetical protein